MIQYEIKKFKQLTSQEVYKIFRLRQEVFIVEQDCAYPDIDDTDLVCHHVLGNDAQGSLIAYSRLVPPATDTQDYVSMGRIITHSSDRGKGIGKELVQKSLDYIIASYPKHALKISAQLHLQLFYQNLGFETIGSSYLEDGIPHVGMKYVK